MSRFRESTCSLAPLFCPPRRCDPRRYPRASRQWKSLVSMCVGGSASPGYQGNLSLSVSPQLNMLSSPALFSQEGRIFQELEFPYVYGPRSLRHKEAGGIERRQNPERRAAHCRETGYIRFSIAAELNFCISLIPIVYFAYPLSSPLSPSLVITCLSLLPGPSCPS